MQEALIGLGDGEEAVLQRDHIRVLHDPYYLQLPIFEPLVLQHFLDRNLRARSARKQHQECSQAAPAAKGRLPGAGQMWRS